MSRNRQVIQQQIENWIRRQVMVPEIGRCTELVLYHLDFEQRPQEKVTVFLIPAREAVLGDIEATIETIVGAAQRDANARACGIQQYAVYAHHYLDRRVPRKVFRAAADPAEWTTTPTQSC
jgi:hypothetical protein